jgi:hypothetical protein
METVLTSFSKENIVLGYNTDSHYQMVNAHSTYSFQVLMIMEVSTLCCDDMINANEPASVQFNAHLLLCVDILLVSWFLPQAQSRGLSTEFGGATKSPWQRQIRQACLESLPNICFIRYVSFPCPVVTHICRYFIFDFRGNE